MNGDRSGDATRGATVGELVATDRALDALSVGGVPRHDDPILQLLADGRRYADDIYQTLPVRDVATPAAKSRRRHGRRGIVVLFTTGATLMATTGLAAAASKPGQLLWPLRHFVVVDLLPGGGHHATHPHPSDPSVQKPADIPGATPASSPSASQATGNRGLQPSRSTSNGPLPTGTVAPMATPGSATEATTPPISQATDSPTATATDQPTDAPAATPTDTGMPTPTDTTSPTSTGDPNTPNAAQLPADVATPPPDQPAATGLEPTNTAPMPQPGA